MAHPYDDGYEYPDHWHKEREITPGYRPSRLPEMPALSGGDEDDLLDDLTPGSVFESIETNMWLADAYFRKGNDGLGIECLRAAWWEYVKFREVLQRYAGEELGKRLVSALCDKTDDQVAL